MSRSDPVSSRFGAVNKRRRHLAQGALGQGHARLGRRGARDEGESERPGLAHMRRQAGPFGGEVGGESVDGRIRPNAASLVSHCFHGVRAIGNAYHVARRTGCSGRDRA
jgi:hypothetical protein